MRTKKPAYLPALEYHWLTPFYDTLLRLTMPELRLRNILLHQSGLNETQRVLDMGCGTATQLALIRGALPGICAIGLDIDLPVLRIAQRNVGCIEPTIPLVCGSAATLPFPNNSFDRIFSMLVLHHLTTEEKQRSLGEANRILKNGGELHIADFGVPENMAMRMAGFVSGMLENRRRMRDNVSGMIPRLCRAAGFTVRETAGLSTIFGTVRVMHCVKD